MPMQQMAHDYRRAALRLVGCPIETGMVGKLADNECEHMNLPCTPRHILERDGCTCHGQVAA